MFPKKKRAHVEKIMKEMNYTPNAFARGLTLNRSKTIGLLVPSLTNPLYPEIARGVEKVAHEKGYSVVLCNTEGVVDKERSYIHMLLEKRMDGLILVSSELTNQEIKKLKENNIHCVLLGRDRKDLDQSTVFTDYQLGAYLATKHLLEIGYRSIAHIRSFEANEVGKEKTKGYLDALKEYGVIVNPDLMMEGDDEVEGGYIATKKLLSKGIPIEAIFASNDLMAIGAMDAIKRNHMSVPDDIGLVGFDDIGVASYVDPKLTTVSQPVHKMGLMAARLIFENLRDDHGVEADQPKIYLQPKLKVRKSCGQEDRLKEIFN